MRTFYKLVGSVKSLPIIEIIRFLTIGVLATIFHSVLYLFLLLYLDLHEQLANLLSFLCAFIFSAFGHLLFTFEIIPDQRLYSIIKFFVVAIFGYAMNSFFVYLTVNFLELDAKVAVLFMLFFTPPFTYLASKFWAFSRS